MDDFSSLMEDDDGQGGDALADLAEAGKTGSVKVVGFDDRKETLDGIVAGDIFGTIAQDQFNYGYHSVRILAEAARDELYGIPVDEKLHFPPVQVTQDSLQDYLDGRTAARR